MGIVVVEELTDDVIENFENESEREKLVENGIQVLEEKVSLKRPTSEDSEDSGRKRQKSEVSDESSGIDQTQVNFDTIFRFLQNL